MSRTILRGRTLLCLLAFVLVVAAPAMAEEPRAEKRRSPRATVQTLFAAVNAARETPKYIDDATACLDLGGLPAGGRDDALLVIQLEAILRAACVNTERIPEEVAGDEFVLTNAQGAHLALHRQPDGRWLFDRDTIARIPQMGAEAHKLLEEKNKQNATLNVSPEVGSPRATFRTFLRAVFRGDAERELRCLNLTEVPAPARQEVGEQLAHKLCQVILRHRSVVYQDIPDSNYSEGYVWLSLPEGTIELIRLPSGERKGEWVFSRQTVRSIDRLYEHFEDRPYHEMLLTVSVDRLRPDFWRSPELWLRERLPAWSKTNLSPVAALRFEAYQLLGCLAFAALAYAVSRVSRPLLVWCVRRALLIGGWVVPGETVARRLRPVGLLFACLVFRSGLLLLDMDKAPLGWVLTVLNPLAWVLGAWVVFRLIDLVGDVFDVRMASSKCRVEVTEMLLPVGSLATKILLAMGLVLHLMSLFAWDVSAVLTGVGIGGVAFALGAQDSLRNLFGSFTLIADRPFVVGETVQIGEGGTGVVERVGLRSTSIRTVEDTLMVVPNSNLTTMNITNFGRRRFRRYTGRIGVVFGTPPERLTAFRDGVRDMIAAQKWTRKDQFEVSIHDLSASAIEIEMCVYFDVTTRHEEVEAREALLLGCLRLAEEMQVELAFPTQTLHLVADGAGAALAMPGVIHAAGETLHKASA